MSNAALDLDDEATEIETLRAMVRTLLGRVESLERTVSAIRDREMKMRRAIGQMAAAADLTTHR